MNRWLPIVALVLLASVVTGRESPPPAPSEPARHAEPRGVPAAMEELDLEKMIRERRGGVAPDLFASQAPAAPAAPSVAARPEPPAPSAPPLPYSYLGRIQRGEQAIVYLRRNRQGMVVAERGETLDGLYRVERITDTAMHLTYLPSGTEQVLSLPAGR